MFLFPLVGWVWSAPPDWIGVFAVTGAIIAALSWLMPRFVSPLFSISMLITIPIGMVVGEVAMLFVFFLVFLPIGCAFKAVRHDRLQLQFDHERQSYWQPKAKPDSIASYFRQF